MIFFATKNSGGWHPGKRRHIDNPCPTVMAEGMGGDNLRHMYIADDGHPDVVPPGGPDKPPYRVPSMVEIAALPRNGFKVASTFSGAGGSCTGYRMAGFDVIWANEFLPAAIDSYRANHPETIVDGRDISKVQPEEILTACGIAKGDLDLFDGSPPCQAFSTAGQREKGWGTDRVYENGVEQRNEELFSEYIRLLRGLMPRTFVAENVSGLVKGVAKGYFKEILRDLKASGYRVSARLLDAQWLGVPQARQRIIFVGVRDDLEADPVHPDPLPYRYTVRDALPWVVSQMRTGSRPGFPPGLGAKSGWQNPGAMRAADRPSPTIGTGTHSGSGRAPPSLIEARSPRDVIQDTAGQFVVRKPIADIPCPTITVGGAAQFLVAGEGDAVTKVGRRPDGVERRRFTIDELKRICAFPDDYILTGSYTQQWERLGNSVPPVMMFHIASAIRDRILAARQSPAV